MKRHHSLPPSWLLSLVLILCPLLPVPSSDAQTVTPSPALGSLGTRVESISRAGGGQTHDITGGRRPGDGGGGTNLFHSFAEFGLGARDAARFINETGRPTTNILSRVTGGNPSNISGEVSTTEFPGANLYIINPAGVMFGPTAKLDVSGSVKVTTANYLSFEDGRRFNAMAGQEADLLSTMPVSAFGFFRQARRAPIRVDGSKLLTNGISLIGGEDITIEKGASVRTSGGRIELVGVGPSPGEVRPASGPEGRVELSGFEPPMRFQMPLIRIAQSHVSSEPITVSGNAGAIEIRGGVLSLQDSELLAATFGKGNAGTINVQVDDTISDENSLISSSSGQGRGGRVALDAPVRIDLSGTTVQSNAPIQPGSVTFEGRSFSADGSIEAVATSDLGTGGEVRIDSGGGFVDSRAGIRVTGGVRGGDVRINVIGEDMEMGGVVDASASNGVGGNIIIEGTGRNGIFLGARLTADGRDGRTGVGRGGNIFILPGLRGFTSSSSLLSAEAVSRSATARAGRIRITTSGDIERPSSPITLQSDTEISTSTRGSGIAGDIVISGTIVRLLDSSRILSISPQDTGGRVEIIRDQLIKDPSSIIDASSQVINRPPQ